MRYARLPSNWQPAASRRFLVTPLTAPWSAIRQCLEAAGEVRHNGSGGARVLGCHMEGPFINPKRAGAQPPEHIRPPCLRELRNELGSLISELRIVTLAPELEGAREVVEFLTQEGVIVSIGHSDATYEQTVQAIEWGCAPRHAHLQRHAPVPASRPWFGRRSDAAR
jgi:N-acetylglucosamine-6-phosphate deacetylase